MNVTKEEKTNPSSPVISPSPANTVPFDEKSWGEKYKVQTYSFIRNWLVNYFINFMAAATLTFAFDTSKLGDMFRDTSHKISEKTGNPPLTRFIINFMTRTQLLLCGGHVLVPLLKWMKDNEKRLQFRTGHALDVLQESLGRGNAASKRNLMEYSHVSTLVRIGDYNSKEINSPIVPELSEVDKAMLAKNDINEELQFRDKKQPWKDVIKARLTGVLFTTLLSIGLALSSSKSVPKALQFRETYETPWGKWLGDNVFSKIPGAKFFERPAPAAQRTGMTGHQLIGEYFIDDAFYTAASKFGFDSMEHKNDKRAAEAEARREEAAGKKEDMLLREAATRKARRMEKPDDYRARADARSNETEAAI